MGGLTRGQKPWLSPRARFFRLSRLDQWVAVVSGLMFIVASGYGFVEWIGREQQDPPGVPVHPTPFTEASTHPTLAPSLTLPPSPPPETTVTAGQTPGQGGEHASPTPLVKPRFSATAELRDGEQSVLLDGSLVVGVSFTEVAGTSLATLRVYHGEVERLEPLLAPKRITVEVAGRMYSIAVERLDFARQLAAIRVNELRE